MIQFNIFVRTDEIAKKANKKVKEEIKNFAEMKNGEKNEIRKNHLRKILIMKQQELHRNNGTAATISASANSSIKKQEKKEAKK